MTCIVGIIENKKVFIGGDSAGVSGYDVKIRKDPKVFKVGDFVIGCTTSYRMVQLIRFSFKPPPVSSDIDFHEYMCTQFVNTLRTCFKEGGLTEIDKCVETAGEFMVGYMNKLAVVQSDFNVREVFEDFQSIGCGQPYALGALKIMDSNLSAEQKILKALEIATHFSAGVRPPFIIEHT